MFITCSDGGELSLWDSRLADGGSLKFPSTPTPQGATSGGSVAGARHGMAVCGGKCATLSGGGDLRVCDRRGVALGFWRLPMKKHSSSLSQFTSQKDQPIKPCVQVNNYTIFHQLTIILFLFFSFQSRPISCQYQGPGKVWPCMTSFL